MANVSPEIVLGMFFLTLSDVNVDFLGWELRWSFYTTEEVFPTIKRFELVSKKEFAAAALDPEYKTYIVYVGSVSSDVLPISSLLDIYPPRRPQISGLIAEEALTKIFAKYLDFAEVFFPDLVSELPKHTGVNNHAIELVNGCHQPFYEPIYKLGLVELEILKVYIETNLANKSIRPSKSPAGAPILFD